MNKTCPKCKYQRKPTDIAPDWECPSYGVAYNKVAKAYKAAKPPPTSSSTKRLSVRLVIIIIGVICVTGLAAFGGVKYIKAQKEKTYKEDLRSIRKFVDVWDSEVLLAGQTARIALSSRVAVLQGLARKWEAVSVNTTCLTQLDAKPFFKKYMDHTIEGFLAFMGNKEKLSENLLEVAETYRNLFRVVISGCDSEILQ